MDFHIRLMNLCLLSVLQGNTVELPEEENTPEKRVDRIFAMMDKVLNTTVFIFCTYIYLLSSTAICLVLYALGSNLYGKINFTAILVERLTNVFSLS